MKIKTEKKKHRIFVKDFIISGPNKMLFQKIMLANEA